MKERIGEVVADAILITNRVVVGHGSKDCGINRGNDTLHSLRALISKFLDPFLEVSRVCRIFSTRFCGEIPACSERVFECQLRRGRQVVQASRPHKGQVKVKAGRGQCHW